MATLGKSTTPNSGTHGWINSNSKQVAMLFTVPAGGGTFTSVSFWAATATSGNIWGVIWDSSGNVLANGVGVATTGGASHNPGPGGDGQFHTDTFTTPKFIPGGTQIYIGWQNNDSVSTFWAYNGGDHSPDAEQRSITPGSPTSFSGHSTESPAGAVAAYATYTPGGVFGKSTSASPTSVLGISGKSTSGAPTAVLGVYWGGVSGGAPQRIF